MSKKIDIGAFSAYAIAVKHGYRGTEAEWIAEVEADRKAAEQAAVTVEAARKAAAQSATEAGNAAANANASKDAAENAARGAAASEQVASIAAQQAACAAGYAGQYETAAAGFASSAANADANAREAQRNAENARSAAAQSAANADEIESRLKSELQKAVDTQVANVVEAGTAQVKAVEDKGAEVLESIPEDYRGLSNDVNGLKDNLTQFGETVIHGSVTVTGLEFQNHSMIADDGSVSPNVSLNRASTGKINALPIGATVEFTDYDKSIYAQYLYLYDKNGSFLTNIGADAVYTEGNAAGYRVLVYYRSGANINVTDASAYVKVKIGFPFAAQAVKQSMERVTNSTSAYYEADNVPHGLIVGYGGAGSNIPESIGTLMCYDCGFVVSNSAFDRVQTFVTRNNKMYVRMRHNNVWTDWEKLLTTSDLASGAENTYGTIALFEKVGVIGDSYASGASGETTSATGAVDHPSISWPQIIGRRNGVSVTNYAKGGLSTRTWLINNDVGLPKLLSDSPCDLYILALVRNDYNIENRGESGYIGTEADMSAAAKPDTFYGNYAKIIEAIKNHSPNAKLVMMTGDYQSNNALGTTYNNAVKAVATHYGLPCMVQLEDDFFTSDYYRRNWAAGGHPSAIIYSGMALAIERMLNKCFNDYKTYFTYYIPTAGNSGNSSVD